MCIRWTLSPVKVTSGVGMTRQANHVFHIFFPPASVAKDWRTLRVLFPSDSVRTQMEFSFHTRALEWKLSTTFSKFYHLLQETQKSPVKYWVPILSVCRASSVASYNCNQSQLWKDSSPRKNTQERQGCGCCSSVTKARIIPWKHRIFGGLWHCCNPQHIYIWLGEQDPFKNLYSRTYL